MAVVIVFPFKLIGQQYLKYFVPPTLEKSVQIKKCGFLQTLPPIDWDVSPKYAIF